MKKLSVIFVVFLFSLAVLAISGCSQDNNPLSPEGSALSPNTSSSLLMLDNEGEVIMQDCQSAKKDTTAKKPDPEPEQKPWGYVKCLFL